MTNENGQPGREFCSPRTATATRVGNENDPFREALPGSPDNRPREEGEVLTNEYATGSGRDILHTTGLTTCVRVAVTGRYRGASNQGNDRFLAHVAETLRKSALQGFINAVEVAKRNGMEIVKSVLVQGEVYVSESDDDSNSDSDDDDSEKRDRKLDAKELREFNSIVRRSIIALVGDEDKVVVETHAKNRSYELLIEENKEIRFGPDKYPDSHLD
ncbi:hypothetical protein ACHAPU_003311 [Fusarium lateritium]